jgi:acyl-CoA thioesterase-2
MAASFQVPEQGFEHQARIPDVPPPEELADLVELGRGAGPDIPDRLRRVMNWRRPLIVKPVDPRQFLGGASRAPRKRVWMKAADRLPDDEFLHAALFAYLSDYELIGTVTLPHGFHADRAHLQMASLDHAMWFHRPLRVDDWLLFDLHSPNASGGRGLAQGRVFSRDGILLASLAQEGLIRQRADPAA